ncbi:hypothetical protein HDU86_004754 [Geranomyces michiganensis]|nr:hypothetical protein HDU86_004754 [Geranomyces michiganensis]
MKRREAEGLSNMAAAEQLFDGDLKESDGYELKERRGHVGVDANGIPLYAYLDSVLFPGDHDRLVAAMEALFDVYPPIPPVKDGRHVRFEGQPERHGGLHLGFWIPQAAKAPCISAETCGPGSKKSEAVRTFLCNPALQLLTFAVNVLFAELDPTVAEKYRNAFKASAPGLRDVWAGNPYQVSFAMIVLVINEYVLKHRDLRDAKDGWCAVVCLGAFEDGEFCLPDLKIRIPFRPGDILFIRSFALEHMVRKWRNGNRYTIVFKMHEGIFEVV